MTSASRWALVVSVTALCVAVATCLQVLVFIIRHDRELMSRDVEAARRLERVRVLAEDDHSAIPALRADLAAIKNWAIALYERASANEWDIPKLPEAIRKESDDARPSEPEEAPVQPAGRAGGGERRP
jgi:hypothetical protein